MGIVNTYRLMNKPMQIQHPLLKIMQFQHRKLGKLRQLKRIVVKTAIANGKIFSQS
jgi:hypothetical protein